MQQRIVKMEAQIEAIRKDVRINKWITIGGAILSIACRFIAPDPAHPAPPPTNSNSVQISAQPADPTTQRQFLTVAEVAKKEGLSTRTIIDYIEAGRILPSPLRNGTRPWALAADYRILPLTAANSGN